MAHIDIIENTTLDTVEKEVEEQVVDNVVESETKHNTAASDLSGICTLLWWILFSLIALLIGVISIIIYLHTDARRTVTAEETVINEAGYKKLENVYAVVDSVYSDIGKKLDGEWNPVWRVTVSIDGYQGCITLTDVESYAILCQHKDEHFKCTLWYRYNLGMVEAYITDVVFLSQ